MASQAGIFNALKLSQALALFPQHNPESSAPGLPVKAAKILYQGTMVAYDPAASEALSADPTMAATAKVIGVTNRTVDNSGGAKGDLKVMPEAGVWRMKSDGNLTAAHLYKPCRVVDDHTVGVPAGTDADRIAGLFVGLDSVYAWVLILPETAVRAPISVTLGNANGEISAIALAAEGSTNGTAAAAADLAALKAEAELIGDDVRDVRTKFATLVTKGEELADDVRAMYNALVTAGILAPAA